MLRLTNEIYLRAGAFATATVLSLLPSVSYAQGGGSGIGTIASNVSSNLGTFPTLMSYASYLGGSGLGISGIMKLREHIDSPTQVKMGQGLGRMAAGGSLIALPYMLSAFVGTMSGGAGGGTVSINSLTNW